MPRKDTRREERLQAIRGLVRRRRIPDQGALCALLRDRGFQVTQASVSRDLRFLAIRKIDGCYREATPLPPVGQAPEVLGRILGVGAAGPHLLVVRTPPGQASAVGIALDQAAWPGMVGCVAGDDTVMVAVEGSEAQARIRERLERFQDREER
ncbi:MAG TPA: arginine repressor [Myxococcota bacterium]|nr:arginine repressor [Myxococcota bacterium]HQK52151.1 arginine repressor [Myxococcota bacterium]